MSNLIRTIQKNALKKQGYTRGPAHKWVVENDVPRKVPIPKHERQIENALGIPVGLHYPHPARKASA